MPRGIYDRKKNGTIAAVKKATGAKPGPKKGSKKLASTGILKDNETTVSTSAAEFVTGFANLQTVNILQGYLFNLLGYASSPNANASTHVKEAIDNTVKRLEKLCEALVPLKDVAVSEAKELIADKIVSEKKRPGPKPGVNKESGTVLFKSTDTLPTNIATGASHAIGTVSNGNLEPFNPPPAPPRSV